ncbi:hypothetical protein [Sediminicoccus sp. KRV36]|uniref:hypothetical protein n=1 Tax=Sediminicoccus sp. KRV36 TaxID=3133721 RepID=UPI00200CE978|nr:hypothetical protein [Sediminicoccus rosea]UPY37932.1 hypothetical protein LHU95_04330 [Sediminicoccus rosea]
MPWAAAQPPGWEGCAGRVIILRTGSQAEGAGFGYWVTLSNPGMRPLWVAPRFADAAPAPPLRIEAGRMLQLRLGEGAANLSAEDVAAATRLRCQAIQTQP